METPKTLQQAIQWFADEQVCINAVASMRWLDGPECPHCLAKEPYYLATQKRWKCRSCRKQFSVKVGTIFEDSAIPLQKWLPALWMLVNAKNGISSYELSKAIGISQKSAWFVLHRLRLVMKRRDLAFKLGGDDAGPVEVDETFVGGKMKNMHKTKKLKLQQIRGQQVEANHLNKTIVMGMLDRELRQVRVTVIPNVKRETLQHEVLREIKYGSKVYTDEWVGYDNLHHRFVHDVVNHMETYVNGIVHTQGIENFWNLFKRTLRGTYVAVEPYHLQRYADEQAFRFNHRSTKENPLNDSDRFLAALAQVANRRLTFAELTGKTGSQTQAEPF
jgi:transposase-like protein